MGASCQLPQQGVLTGGWTVALDRGWTVARRTHITSLHIAARPPINHSLTRHRWLVNWAPGGYVGRVCDVWFIKV